MGFCSVFLCSHSTITQLLPKSLQFFAISSASPALKFHTAVWKQTIGLLPAVGLMGWHCRPSQCRGTVFHKPLDHWLLTSFVKVQKSPPNNVSGYLHRNRTKRATRQLYAERLLYTYMRKQPAEVTYQNFCSLLHFCCAPVCYWQNSSCHVPSKNMMDDLRAHRATTSQILIM